MMKNGYSHELMAMKSRSMVEILPRDAGGACGKESRARRVFELLERRGVRF